MTYETIRKCLCTSRLKFIRERIACECKKAYQLLPFAVYRRVCRSARNKTFAVSASGLSLICSINGQEVSVESYAYFWEFSFSNSGEISDIV